MGKKLDIWYQEGLRFKCTECGKCCTGAPGYVWLTEEDIKTLAEHLQISVDVFLKTYTRLVDQKRSLTECPTTFDCVFLKGKRCTVYEARPSQCKKFPWWISNLKSRSAWEAAAIDCEGINAKDAPLFSPSQIKNLLDS